VSAQRDELGDAMTYASIELLSIYEILNAFGNRTLSDLSGFISEINSLSSEKNSLISLRVLLPNAPHDEL
jgi:hypothetical protein